MKACRVSLMIGWIFLAVLPFPVAAQNIEFEQITFAPGTSLAQCSIGVNDFYFYLIPEAVIFGG